jgi:rhamnose transport system substrate-binding protein
MLLRKKLRAGKAGVGLVAAAAMLAASASPVSASSTAKYTFAYIETQTGIPYYAPIVTGITKETKKLGNVSFYVTGPATPGSSAQIPEIDQAIVRHVNAILINQDSNTAIQPALHQAEAAGIKVVEVNDDFLPGSVVGDTAVNNAIVPLAQLTQLGQLMNFTGDFAVLSASSTSVFQNGVIVGFRNLLKTDAKFKHMTMVKVVYGDDESAPSANATTALLTEYPNLKAITSPTTVGFAAAAQAIDSAHKAKKIIITGLGEPIEMKKFILNGTVKEYQLWDVENMGYVGAYVAYEAVKGEKFPVGKTFTIPGSGLGTLLVSPGNGIYCQKTLTTFNLANVKEYNF